MNVVLDVSAAFALITEAPGHTRWRPHFESAEQVIAPDLFVAEATNTAWKYHHNQGISPKDSRQMAHLAIRLVDVFVSSKALWEQALEWSCRNRHPLHDALYLVLAKQEEAMLLTLDKRLVEWAKEVGVSVIEP